MKPLSYRVVRNPAFASRSPLVWQMGPRRIGRAQPRQAARCHGADIRPTSAARGRASLREGGTLESSPAQCPGRPYSCAWALRQNSTPGTRGICCWGQRQGSSTLQSQFQPRPQTVVVLEPAVDPSRRSCVARRSTQRPSARAASLYFCSGHQSLEGGPIARVDLAPRAMHALLHHLAARAPHVIDAAGAAAKDEAVERHVTLPAHHHR